RQFVFDVSVELFECFGHDRKAYPQHSRVSRRREAPCPANLNFKWTDSRRRALDSFSNPVGSSRLDTAEELQGQMNIRWLRPAYLRIDLLQRCLKSVDSLFDRFGYLDADERADDVGGLVAGFASIAHP